MLRKLLVATWLCLAVSGWAADPLNDALQAIDKGDYSRAATLLRPLADAGNPVAQLKLAVLKFYGHGVAENEKQALELATKSAKQGNLDAMFFVGNIYTFGNEAARLTSDPDIEAAKWYFEAARQGHAEAEYSLGLMFLAGKGVIQSQEEGLKWIRRAADHGHAGAKSFFSNGASPQK